MHGTRAIGNENAHDEALAATVCACPGVTTALNRFTFKLHLLTPDYHPGEGRGYPEILKWTQGDSRRTEPTTIAI